MIIKIKNTNFDFSVFDSFNESVSKLNKIRYINFSLNVFEDEKELHKKLFELNVGEVGQVIVSKMSYHWIFEDCYIESISVPEKRSTQYGFINYVKFKMTFKKVYGTNKLQTVLRDNILSEILDD